ncbi:MAG: ATP synthase F1 subunit epsilon [Parcubacteria group bacterium]|nr:ATP synthase F1 subunit epsilon [Parcubacteria group bacterium]
MRLRIFTLKKPVWEKEVSSINLQTAAGELTILDNHEPYLTVVREGDVIIKTADGEREAVSVSRGILEVLPENIVNIAADLKKLSL